MKTTNIEEIRDLAIVFLHFDATPNKQLPFVIDHPYFDSVIVGLGKELIDIREEENLKKVREKYTEMIRTGDLTRIMLMIRSPYRFTFLKYAKPYLKKADFDEWLAHLWVESENPNQDVNVSIRTFISWFRKADKRTIMTEEDYDYYSKLPDVVEVYRGVAVGRAEQKGLSWTCKYETADWFSKRFDNIKEGKFGYIIKAKINKEDVFAYFNTRNEDEVLCNSSKIYDVERIERT